ncbi:uncharacterized protein ACRADG_009990 [Cochliomyia hominivorax]
MVPLFVRLNYYLNLVLGITLFYFNPSKNLIQLNNWLCLTYGTILHIFTFIFLQYGTYIFWYTERLCQINNFILAMNLLLLLTNYITYKIILIETWRKRKRLFKLVVNYWKLLKYYKEDLKSTENVFIVKKCKILWLGKFLSMFSELFLLHLQAFVRFYQPKCGVVDRISFVCSDLFFTVLHIVYQLVNLNLYMGLIVIYMCVEMLKKRLQKIARDIEIIHDLYITKDNRLFNLKNLIYWRLKLAKQIEIIARNEQNLKDLVLELMSIYEWQFLMILCMIFLVLLLILFFILVYVVSFENVNFFKSLFLSYVFISHMSNNILFFNVCELLINSFKQISFEIHKMYIYAAITQKTFQRDALELNTQSRDFKLSICGLFDIKNATSIKLLAAIVLNLMCLLQIFIEIK